MPIYEYRCPKCSKIFEEWSHITEDHPQEPCPDCGTPSPRIMSSTSFILEGGGWYVTDYGYRKGVKEDGAASSSGSDAKAESKAEAGEGSKTAATSGTRSDGKAAAKSDAGAGTKPAGKPAASKAAE